MEIANNNQERSYLYIWASTVLSLPLLAGCLIVARQLFGIRTGIGAPDFAPATYWSLALPGMLAGLAGAAVAGRYLLAPRVLAQRAFEVDPADPEVAVREQLGKHLLVQLGIFDVPACLLVAHSMAYDNDVSAVLVLVYGVVGLVLLRPDVGRLTRVTVQEMERLSLPSR